MGKHVSFDATPLLSPEEQHCLSSVLEWLQPTGGYTLYNEDGQPAGSVCGDRNIPRMCRASAERSRRRPKPRSTRRRSISARSQCTSDGTPAVGASTWFLVVLSCCLATLSLV